MWSSPAASWRTCEATAAEFAALPGKIVPVACHVGRLDQLENLVRETEKQLGPIDILVNNSATNIGQGPALDVTDEMLDKMVEINVKSCAAAGAADRAEHDRAQGGGSIINIASIAGLQPQPGGLLYSFTKAGLIMMTRCVGARVRAAAASASTPSPRA